MGKKNTGLSKVTSCAGLIATLVLTGGAAAVTLAASPAATASPGVEHHAAVDVQQVPASLPELRDEAAMVLLGTALIGLGAAVRRSM
jgi:hypothetical protein